MVILAILAILWAGVIGSWLKERASSRQGDSVLAFREQLTTLQRTQPGGIRNGIDGRATPSVLQVPAHVASSRAALANERMRQRRRDILLGLGIVAGVTFLAAAFTGSAALIGLNVVCDLAAGAYVFALVSQQRVAQERQAKVRYLSASTPPGSSRPVRPARPARPARPGVQPARRPATRVEPAMLRRTVAN